MSAALPASEIIIPPGSDVRESKNETRKASTEELSAPFATRRALALFGHPACRAERGPDQVGEQTFCGSITKHSLRMPLNADHPVRVASPLDAFDGAVVGVRRDPQAVTRRGDSLMMRAVDFASPRARNRGEQATLLEGSCMAGARPWFLGAVWLNVPFFSRRAGF